MRTKIFNVFIIGGLLLVSSCSNFSHSLPTETIILDYPVLPYKNHLEEQYPAPTPVIRVFQEEILGADIEFPLLDQGMAALGGVLYSYTVASTIPGTAIYLTHAIGDNKNQPPTVLVGPQESRGDIAATTDENGYFLFNNIKPGNYFLVVWAPLSWSMVEISENDQKPKLIELNPDQQLNLGAALVSWP